MQATSWAITGFIAAMLIVVGIWGWSTAMYWLVPLFCGYTVVWIASMMVEDWLRDRRK